MSPSEGTRHINALAPIRICDMGGWTDTWFAGHGAIFNIAVSPYAEVHIEVSHQRDESPQIILHAENFNDHYPVDLHHDGWQRHPLLEAAIRYIGVPMGTSARINLYSLAPSGASTGTSAAVCVALVGALAALSGQQMSPQQAAFTAHAIETERLGRQSGIQDQLCSAYGGINFIEIPQYPQAIVTPLSLEDSLWWELEQRLSLIYLGKSHDSSKIHEKVISELRDSGPDCSQLEDLRLTAVQSRDALLQGDLKALGQAMIANTEAQARLHPELVSADARQVIEIARQYHASGWKVNGAGGEGGSLTLLGSPRPDQRHRMVETIQKISPLYRLIPIQLDHWGLRVWETKSE